MSKEKKKVQLVQRGPKNKILKNEEYDVEEFVQTVLANMSWFDKLFRKQQSMVETIHWMIDKDD